MSATMHQGLGLENDARLEAAILGALLEAASPIPRLRTFLGSTTLEVYRTPDGIAERRLIEPATADAHARVGSSLELGYELWERHFTDQVLLVPKLPVVLLSVSFDEGADAARTLFGDETIPVHQLESVMRNVDAALAESNADPTLADARRLLAFCHDHELVVRIRP